jgi:lysophospholipase L1-like esterase
MNKNLSLLILAILSFTFANAQKKIVVLGSSTAAGAGASQDSAWTARLQAHYRKNTSDGVDTTIENLAVFGFVTYQVMPNNFVTPVVPDRTPWPVNVEKNVTKALSFQPDIIIINLPSNDVFIAPDYNMKETMDNFRALNQQVTAAGVRCYITTTQPRNTPEVYRLMLRQLRDSILNNFGTFAINFWDDLVTNDGLNNLRDDRRADDVHPNNTGHRFLFERVVARNIFGAVNVPLPVKITHFKALLQGRKAAISWHAEEQEQGTVYEVQRSSDGQQYKTVFTQPTTAARAADYSYTDNAQLSGAHYYRLKITEPGQVAYSKIVRLNFDNDKSIARLFINSAGLHVEFGTTINGAVDISIVNAAGAAVYKGAQKLASATTLSIPVSTLPTGQYFLRLLLPGGGSEVQSFIK